VSGGGSASAGGGTANGAAAGVTGAKAAGAASFAKALCLVALPGAIAGSVALAPHRAISPQPQGVVAMAPAPPTTAPDHERLAPTVGRTPEGSGRHAMVVPEESSPGAVVAPAVDPPAVVAVVKPPPAAVQAARREAHPASTAESTLGAESALVVSARAALRSGDCSAALSRLDGARASFGAGALDEEREAMSIEALACSGRPGEASSRASDFLRVHPESLHAGFVRRFVR
jgi:hypothetical protein